MKTVSITACRVLLGAYFLAVLMGCSQPKFASQGETAATSTAGPAVVHTSVPGVTPWARQMLGKSIKELFPNRTAACVGNLDSVLTRYTGAHAGAELFGWGWDTTEKKPITRILIADKAGDVVGAGTSGFARPDVSAARPEIHSSVTGWRATVQGDPSEIYAWGVVAGPRTVCPLGRLTL